MKPKRPAGPRLGELLETRGRVKRDVLIEVLRHQRASGGRIGTCLLELEKIAEDDLLHVLSDQLKVPFTPPEELRTLPEEITKLIPEKVARQRFSIPLRSSSTYLTVAMRDPTDLLALDELAFVTGKRVRPQVASEIRILEALAKYYGVELASRFVNLIDRLNRERYFWGRDAAAEAATGGIADLPPLQVPPRAPDLRGPSGEQFQVPAAGSPPTSARHPSGEILAPIVSVFTARPAPASPPAPPSAPTPVVAPPIATAGLAPSPAPSVPVPPAIPVPAAPPLAPVPASPLSAASAISSSPVASPAPPPSVAPPLPAPAVQAPASVPPAPSVAPPPPPLPPQPAIVPPAPLADAPPAPAPEAPPVAPLVPPAPVPAAAGASSAGLLPIDDAEARLRDPNGRDEIGQLLLEFARGRAASALLLMVRRDEAAGWLGFGPGLDDESVESCKVELNAPSFVRALRDGASQHRGALAELPAHAEIRAMLGTNWATDLLALPLRVRERLVGVLVVTLEEGVFSPEQLDEITRLVGKASMALELLVLKQKLHG